MKAADNSPANPINKWQEMPLWLGGAALAVVFVGDGVLQLLGRSPLVPVAPLQNLREWLPTAVGLTEITAGALLLWPSVVSFAAVTLGLIMAGGIYLQLQSGIGPLLLSPLLLCVGLALIGYERSPRVRSVRRLKSVLNTFAEEEILREELRREALPRPLSRDRRRLNKRVLSARR
jgi:hypothetical protein